MTLGDLSGQVSWQEGGKPWTVLSGPFQQFGAHLSCPSLHQSLTGSASGLGTVPKNAAMAT